MKATRWNGHAQNGSWFAAGNWSGGVPAAGLTAVFNDKHTWSISLAGPQPAQSGAMFVIGDALTFTGGSLTASVAQPVTGYKADLTIGGGGSVTVSVGATLVTPADIAVGTAVAGTLTSGALNVHGTLDASILDLHYGSMTVSGRTAHVVLSSGLFINLGNASLTIADGGKLDAGPDTLKVFYSSMTIGSGSGAGTLTIGGTGSSFTLGIVYAGTYYNGDINVVDGGFLNAGVIYAGRGGDGHIKVNGAGSSIVAVNGLVIGDVNVLPVGSSLTVTDGGTVTAQNFAIDLQYGTLVLDGSASLNGTIVSKVGNIEALVSKSAGNTVTIHNSVVLQSNNGTQGQYDHNTTVYTQTGGTLAFAGVISGDTDAVLSAGTGHIILSNGANNYGSTADFNATVEIAAKGAAGGGTFVFTGGPVQAPVLQIDAGAALTNTIASFAGLDTIDLRGFAFGTGVTDNFANGELKLSNGATLAFAGTYTAANFTFADDHHGGTLVAFKHG
jgi:hypothetical protein